MKKIIKTKLRREFFRQDSNCALFQSFYIIPRQEPKRMRLDSIILSRR